MATIHELQDALRERLEGNGVLGTLRAQVRGEIFKALDAGQDLQPPKLSNENLLINDLFREYLTFNRYRNTLSVFQSESGQPALSLGRSFMAQQLHVTEDENTNKLPLLYTLIAHAPMLLKQTPPVPSAPKYAPPPELLYMEPRMWNPPASNRYSSQHSAAAAPKPAAKPFIRQPYTTGPETARPSQVAAASPELPHPTLADAGVEQRARIPPPAQSPGWDAGAPTRARSPSPAASPQWPLPGPVSASPRRSADSSSSRRDQRSESVEEAALRMVMERRKQLAATALSESSMSRSGEANEPDPALFTGSAEGPASVEADPQSVHTSYSKNDQESVHTSYSKNEPDPDLFRVVGGNEPDPDLFRVVGGNEPDPDLFRVVGGNEPDPDLFRVVGGNEPDPDLFRVVGGNEPNPDLFRVKEDTREPTPDLQRRVVGGNEPDPDLFRVVGGNEPNPDLFRVKEDTREPTPDLQRRVVGGNEPDPDLFRVVGGNEPDPDLFRVQKDEDEPVRDYRRRVVGGNEPDPDLFRVVGGNEPDPDLFRVVGGNEPDPDLFQVGSPASPRATHRPASLPQLNTIRDRSALTSSTISTISPISDDVRPTRNWQDSDASVVESSDLDLSSDLY